MNAAIASSPETTTNVAGSSTAAPQGASAASATAPIAITSSPSSPLDLAEISRQLSEVEAQANRLRDVAAQLKVVEAEKARAEAAAQLAAKQVSLREALAQLGANSAAKGYAVVRQLFASTPTATKPSKPSAKRAQPKVASKAATKPAAPKQKARTPVRRGKLNARGYKLVVRGPYSPEVWAGVEAGLRQGASVRSLSRESGVGELSIQNRRKKLGLVGKVAGGLNVIDLIKAGKVEPLLKAA